MSGSFGGSPKFEPTKAAMTATPEAIEAAAE